MPVHVENPKLIDSMQNLTKIPNQQYVPRYSSDTYTPVLLVNDAVSNCSYIVRSNILSNALGATIYTTNNNKNEQFYVTGAVLSVSTTTTTVGLKNTIQVTINGTAREILTINYALNTGSKQNYFETISFPFPIPVDKNTNIQVTADDSTSISAEGIIYGFYAPIINTPRY